MPPAQRKDLGAWLAIAYLRLGEQQNCAMTSGRSACLFPLQKSAVHKLPRGAEGAVRELSALLEADPHDAQSQWLLNVACMQLGRYPQDVPAPWLIPASRFASEAPLPEFPEVAASEGLDITSHAGGVLVEDFDGDGLLDVMVTSSGPLDQMHLFHNNGNGTFTDVTRRSGLIGETGGLNLVLTDYNNDGHPDVLVLRGGWWGKQGCYPMSLLRNNGNGTFTDVTVEARPPLRPPHKHRRLGRLRQRRLARPLRRARGRARIWPPPTRIPRNSSTTTTTAPSPRSALPPASPTLASSKASPGATSTTTAAPTSTSPSCTARTISSATTALAIQPTSKPAGSLPT